MKSKDTFKLLYRRLSPFHKLLVTLYGLWLLLLQKFGR